MSKITDEEIEKCPFCNGEAILIKRGNEHTKKRSAEIECTNCHVKLVVGAIRNSLDWCVEKVCEKWNKRIQNKVSDPATEQSTKYLSAEEVLSKYVWNGFSHSRSEEDCLKAMREYASIVNKRKDNVGVCLLHRSLSPTIQFSLIHSINLAASFTSLSFLSG